MAVSQIHDAGPPRGWPAVAYYARRFERPARHGSILAILVLAALLGGGQVPLGVDAHAYWASDPLDPYRNVSLGTFDGYFYSPAFTQALGPLHAVPFPLFVALWVLLSGYVLVRLSGPYLPLILLMPPAIFQVGSVLFAPPVIIELTTGNVHILMAAAIVVGFRHPAAWSFLLLTKVTPGIGIVWFAARGEWLRLAIAVGATAVIVALSYALAPAAWADWVGLLLSRSQDVGQTPGWLVNLGPLALRLPIALAIVAWAARTDRRWVVPLAAILAMPVIWPNTLAVAIALIPLLRRRSMGATRAVASGEGGRAPVVS